MRGRAIFKKILYVLLMLCLLGIVVCGISVWVSYNVLTVTNYSVNSDKINQSFRIVFVSDLHDHVFGNDNDKLVEKMLAQKPDIIVLDGDIINGDSENSDVATSLIKQLKDKVTIYYSLGNHEIEYMNAGHDNLIDELESAGAIVLNEKVEDTEINGNPVRLGGLYQYSFDTRMQSDEDNQVATAYKPVWQDTDRYKIMCAHRPESFYCWDSAQSWGIDLLLSGHLHGGQVIIPFVGGLYEPLNGFWPEYDYGIFDIVDCKMIITRGLSSNHKKLPRFNNTPEIVVVDVKNLKED